MAGIFRLYDLPMQDQENIDFVKVKTDTLSAGMLIVANDLEGTYIDGLGAVYTPGKPSAVSDANLAIVAPEEYYIDAMGNRIPVTDPTKFDFTTGNIVRIVRPAMNKKYFVSNDLITGTPAKSGWLIPTASAYGWTFTSTVGDIANAKVVLYVEQINVKDTFIGLAPVTGVRVRVIRATGV